MEAFSDDEFYEAKDEISSVSGSDSTDEDGSEIGKQRSRRGSSKPPRHDRPPQWFAESRFSVWQDGPKSIQERRRLLYERFGLLRRRDERTEGEGTTARAEGAEIRMTRFGTRDHILPARKGLVRGSNPHVDTGMSELAASNGNRSISLESANGGTERGSSRSLADLEPLMLGRSQSDSAAVLIDGKIGNPGMGALYQSACSAGTSPRKAVPGIERLTQTSGAVLREGKWGPSGLRPPTGIRAIGALKSAPSNLQSFASNIDRMSNGCQSLAAEKHEVRAADSSPALVSADVKLASDVADPSPSQTWTLGEGANFDSPNGNRLSKSVGLVEALQTIAISRQMNQDRSPSFDESNDVAYKIKDLDSGKEFIIDELGTDGDPKLRELDTGKELTLDEFESSLGLSPVMQEVRRREREKDNLDDDDAVNANDSTASSKKKKSLWVRTMKGVAKTVGVAKGSRAESGGEEQEDSAEKGRKIQGTKVSNDPPESLRPRSPQRVKVQVYKKNYKDLSDLNLGQEIQAHQGAIWTMKFSLDGRYLASAGQDRVVYVREVLDRPFTRDHVAQEGVVESSGVKGDEGTATPEHSQQSKEASLGRRGTLLKAVGKRKLAKSNTSGKLPKLFWLSEASVCTFKGHTEDVLDLSWSRSQFLLSSSMDKTVRLWHMSCGECLRVFTHSDYVTCIEFNPKDDRYFLSGSLDDKVRIWSIPDHQVVDWSDVREMVTAASYSQDGKRAVIGTYKGTCRFYNTTGNSLQLGAQIDVRNAQSKKARAKKITGLQFMPGESSKVLITSNDSRVRVYDGQELSLKFKGLKNINSQISARFNRTGEYIISASEDSRVYIWNSGLQDFRGSRKDKPQSYEYFPSSNVSIAVPWPGMDPQPSEVVLKEDQSELDTSSSRQSANDGPLRSPLRCSPCSSSSSRSNGSTHSGSGLTNESVAECKSEQSMTSLLRNGLGREAADEEVTSKRSDGSGSYMAHFGKPGALFNSCFRESPCRDDRVQPSFSSPALSVSNDSPPVERASMKSSGPIFFTDAAPKGSATWPEEKLPPLPDSARSQGGSWSASSPSQEILSTELTPEGSTADDAKIVATWGQVIVTASLGGEIRTFQNYGYPVRL